MPLNIPLIPALLFCTAIFFTIIANVIFNSILGEINSIRPPSEQISIIFVSFRVFEVIRIHKQLFPSSRKPVVMYGLFGVGFAVLLSVLFV